MKKEQPYSDSDILSAIRSINQGDGVQCTIERVVNLLYPNTSEAEMYLRKRTDELIPQRGRDYHTQTWDDVHLTNPRV